MAKATRICKVCGKEYEYCKTWLSTDKFRWQDVACSPEHAAEYFAMIEASRAKEPAKEDAKPVEEKKQTKRSPKKETKVEFDIVEEEAVPDLDDSLDM